MKRTNVVLDVDLLKEATRVLGVKTYSSAINIALQEVIRLRKIEAIRDYFGAGVWEGDLTEMRQDQPKAASAGLP